MKRIILSLLLAASSAVHAMQQTPDQQLIRKCMEKNSQLRSALSGSDLRQHVAEIRDMMQLAITHRCINRVGNFDSLITLLEGKGVAVAPIAELRAQLEQLRSARTDAQAQEQAARQEAVVAARKQLAQNVAQLERVAGEQDVAAFRVADVEASIKQALESIERLPDEEQAACRAHIEVLKNACLAQTCSQYTWPGV